MEQPTVTEASQSHETRGWYTKCFSKLDVSLSFPWKNMVFLSVTMQNKQRSSLTQLSRLKPPELLLAPLKKMPTFLYLLKRSETLHSKKNDSGEYLNTVLFSSPRHRPTLAHTLLFMAGKDTTGFCLNYKEFESIQAQSFCSKSEFYYRKERKKINVVFPLQAVLGNSTFKTKLQDSRCKIHFV